MIYVYDGTWDGLMCLVYRTAEAGGAPEDILRLGESEGYLFETARVDNDPAVAEATDAVLRKRLSGRMLSRAWLALLSCERADMALWHVLADVWQRGKRAEADLAGEYIRAVNEAALRTSREYNKYLGLVRFGDVGGIYYARLEPECDIVTLLAEHFAERMPGHGWVLHDLRRGKAAVYDGKSWFVTNMNLPHAPPSTDEEEAYQELWRAFYRSTTTRQRLNYKAQRGNMPKKYWKYLVETPGEFHGKGDTEAEG